MVWKNLELLKQTRAKTLHMVHTLDQPQMDWEPQPGKWSAGEQLDHLLLAEKLYRGTIAELIALVKSGKPAEIRRTLADIDFRPNFIPSSALPLFEIPFTIANLFIPSGLRELMIRRPLFPAQRPEIANPVKGKPAGALLRALAESLHETVHLLESNRGMDFSRMTLEHPVLGKNDVPFLVKLIALHEQRHQEQIEAILAKLPASQSAVAV